MNHNYLSSEGSYCSNDLLEMKGYLKFYNVKSDKYSFKEISLKSNLIDGFLDEYGVSQFAFFTSIFSLYLSRIDNTKGCLLKTVNDGNIERLLKIDYNPNKSFIDYLIWVSDALKDNACNTGDSDKKYLSSYSIQDFTDLNENASRRYCEGDALSLNIYGNSLELAYNEGLFSKTYIEHMLSNIEFLIYDVLNSPDQICSKVDILSQNEKDLIFKFSQSETVDIDEDNILSKKFRQNAIENPEKIAIDDGINQISYGKLEHDTNSIAYDLCNNHGIGSGTPVGLLLPRSYHYPELVLALNKISAVFIPIDPEYPQNRIKHMLDIGQCKHIVSTREFEDLDDFDVDVIFVEDLNRDYDEVVEICGSGDDLFCIIFTSGTTGLPKGVMFSNKQMVACSAFFKHLIGSFDGMAGCYSSFSFVGSFRMFAALYLGDSSRLFNDNERKDSLKLLEILEKENINDIVLPPNLGILIFEINDLDLNYIIVGGAKLNEISKKNNRTKLINYYASTENFLPISNLYDVDSIGDSLPIGRPAINSNVYILDKNLMKVPIGVIGEICISTDYMSPGYVYDEETTNRAFVPNPYSTQNKRLFRTGDLGFFNFDGEVEYVGRWDNQLSVGGFRVESGEILKIMNNFDQISEIYLDVDNDVLIAYYTTNGDLDIGDVKKSLEMELPYYMIPALFIELDEIPLNFNGKIDKFALKSSANRNEFIEDGLLLTIVDSFKEVLNTDFVLINDDFVSLGGNSISAMRLQLLLKEKLNIPLSSNELIELSTPLNMANHIRFILNNPADIDNVNYTFEDVCPLSESQLNVYLDEAVENIGTAYNNPYKIDFKKGYSADEIKNALIKLFDVFPIFKARVMEGECLSFDAEPEIEEGSLNDMESFVKPFDLSEYLARFLIVADGKSSSLCLDVHHLIFDGTSLNVILNRLFSILNDESADFIDDGFLRQVSYEENISQDYMGDAREFFDAMLSDKDEVYGLLPSVNNENDDSQYFNTFEVNKNDLHSFLQNNHITHNQFFSSVFAYTLSRFIGCDKVLFNLVEDGRGHMDLSESVGMFVRTLPVLMDCKNQEVSSFLDYSSSLINSVMKYDLYPFRILAKEYDLNTNILFQYSHDLFRKIFDRDNLDYVVDELKHDVVDDFIFYIFDSDENNLSIKIMYSDKYSKEFVERFVESYKLILMDMMSVERLSHINYTLKSDLALLDEYNDKEKALKYEDVLDAFNENLSRCPDENLVVYDDRSYTYAQGAFMADRIANALKKFSVEKQEPVAFLVERSELYLFCAMGIMSVGAVYVPIDEVLPDESIRFMIKDTGARVVIASDETYGRVDSLTDNSIILNASDIFKGNISTLSNLPVVHGDLACILYTSGSTGIPKGVKITRRAISNLSSFYVDEFALDCDDSYGLCSSIGFDISNFIINFTLYAGICLYVVPEDIRLNMNELNNYFIENNVTHTFLTTQLGKLFAQSIDRTSLDFLLVGGEKLGEFKSPEDYNLIDIYGPTEAFTFISQINNSSKIDYSSVGQWNYNNRIYILDGEGRRVPIGAVGELYLAGNQLTPGYLDFEQNNKSLSANPFDESGDYGQIYSTGDLVRLLPDKSLGIVGRLDSQVKIRGNRVELSEVESAIRDMDSVEDVTVQTVNNDGNNELVAYVVVSEDMDEDNVRDSVCNHVGMNKPEYMIPSHVIKLDMVPLTVNGKIDRFALPEVDLDGLQVDYVGPATKTEKIIVEVFESVFHQKVGLHDDFVKLGGDSLMAIKMVALLVDERIDIDVRTILNNKTPYKIAKMVDGDQTNKGFILAKKGVKSQNMFLIPPIGGLSFIFAELVENMDYSGNIYMIDDFRYDMDLDEIRKTGGSDMTLDYYYDSIKDLFNDGDIIFGYSIGCIFAALLVERLEKHKRIGQCVLTDGFLMFTGDATQSEEDLISFIKGITENYDMDDLKEEYGEEFIEKFIEITNINSKLNFPNPKINSKITYLTNTEIIKENVEEFLDNYDFIILDSTHTDIIAKDCNKISKYLI